MTTCTLLSSDALDVVLRLGDYELKFEYKEFGDKYEEIAKRELREVPEVLDLAIPAFRKLVHEEPDFTFLYDGDAELKTFLRPCKYYPESALERMRKFYKFKAKQPKYYEGLLPSREKEPFDQSLLTIVPERTQKGERVLIIEAGRKWTPKDCSLTQLTRGAVVIFEAAIKEPRTQVAGAHIILDMEGLSMQHIWQFTPIYARDLVHFVQDCIPLRLKGVHIVNQPYVFNMLFAIFKPFLAPKLRSRIHFHGTNFSTLHQFIDKSILPHKYDGLADFPMDEGAKMHACICECELDYIEMAKSGYFKGKK